MINKMLAPFKRRAAHRNLRSRVHEAAARVVPDKRVIAGPFQGLEYAEWRGHGSAVFAKLLGTYEAELHPFVMKVLASQPHTVIDIGCAEGFYAVGCARALPHAKIIAADLSSEARALCLRMAILNQVQERVKVMGRVAREDLAGFAAKPGGLVIADCEGGEDELFDKDTFRKLAGWFILIELHEFLVPGIEERLIKEAAVTHAIEVIDSVDDYRRPNLWPRPAIESFPRDIRHEFYREGRPGLMRWLCASPVGAGES